MAIKIRCSCGKPLTIADPDIGKRLACPDCGKPFRISPEKVAACAMKKKAQGESAGAAAREPKPEKQQRPATAAPEPQPADLDQDVLTLIGDGEPMAAPPSELLEGAPSVVLVEDAVELSYARGSSKARARAEDDSIQDSKHSFWLDLTLASVYPVQSIGNVLTFLGLVVLALVQAAAGLVGIAGPMIWIGRFTLYGCFCAFYMAVVIETSAGSSKLPGIHFDGSWWDDVIRPGLLFILAQIIVFAPPLLLAWRLDTIWPAVICLGITLFLCPMIILLFSLSDAGQLIRIDLIAQTILRTLPPYLLICLLLVAASAFDLIVPVARLLNTRGAIQLPPGHLLLDPGVGLTVLRVILGFYMTAVCMRLIGLYYLHFKHKFAFEFE